MRITILDINFLDFIIIIYYALFNLLKFKYQNECQDE